MRHHTPAEIRWRRRMYDRLYRSGNTIRGAQFRIVIPDDVSRFEGVPEPCPMCGAGRVLCKHRARVMG